MKVNITRGARSLALTGWLVLVWLVSLDAQAFISGNLECNVTGSKTDGYTFQAGAEMQVSFSGSCTVKRTFPKGAAVNLQVGHILGANPARLRVMDFYNHSYMSELPLGSYGVTCLGGPCKRLAVGSNVSYTYAISGTAPSTPGRRTAMVTLGVTSAGYPNYAEWFHNTTFIYDVTAVSCTLSTPSAVNLSFGTISSTNIGSHLQSTDISIYCPSSMRADITLTPNQAQVDARIGVSRTTLPGLNMQALWNGQEPVNFTSYIHKYLVAGQNRISLSFKPVLEAGQSPAVRSRVNTP